MVQYLIAVWDYTAEGQYELSFKQGDRIKLLEKHNDDWWEGELNDEIGFFPANRIRLETEQDVREASRGSERIHAEPAQSNASHPSTDIFAPGEPAELSSTIKEHAIQPDANIEHDIDIYPTPPPRLPPRNNAGSSASVQPQLPPRPSNNITLPPQLPPRHSQDDFAVEPVLDDTSILEFKEETLVDVSNDDDDNNNNNGYPSQKPDDPMDLPAGWQHAYDNDGTIYYFNLQTGESRWDKPEASFDQSVIGNAQSNLLSPPLADTFDELGTSEKFQKLNPEDLKKLRLDQLHPEWIRLQGFVQMKMAAGKEDGGKLSSWKLYYAVLSNGFLLLYKDGYSKSKKYAKPLIPVGSFDLDSCQIEPASKNDTKRKHAFLITTPKKVTIYIQTASEKELAAWLDAIMRELIARKEGSSGEDSEILRLLKNLTVDSEQMKVNRKMTRKTSTKDGDEKDDQKGKPKSLGHWFGKTGKNSDKLPQQAVAGTTVQNSDNCVFGGFLTVEEGEAVPRVVRCCIEQVNARGVKSVGVYRLSGPASSIQKYRSAFNKGEPVDLSQEPDINVVTGLLKLYFRELKNPLMTYEYYDWFIDAARIPDYDERMYRIKSIIHVLPEANYTLLEYLMRHLNYVAAYSDVNKMETSNLALIFSVGLLRPPQEDLSSIMHTDLQSKIIEAIIQQVDWFFEQDQEEEEEEGAATAEAL